MKKNGILHVELMRALTAARHKDTIVILDAGMPIPDGCNVIDLALVKGIPSFLDTLKAVLNEIVVEHYAVFEPMIQYNPQMYETVQKILCRQTSAALSQQEFTEIMKTSKAVIRTADFRSCCNLILYSASGMDRYVDKYDLSFEP